MAATPAKDHTSGKNWHTSTFEFKENCCMCMWAWCIPFGFACMQCTDAKVAVDPSEGVKAFLCAWCLCCIGGAINRGKIRETFSLEGSFILDCMCEWCCPCCSVTQEWYHVMKEKKGDGKKLIWQVWGSDAK
jgi:Cys-rich protein (TIGR01571 family)